MTRTPHLDPDPNPNPNIAEVTALLTYYNYYNNYYYYYYYYYVLQLLTTTTDYYSLPTIYYQVTALLTASFEELPGGERQWYEQRAVRDAKRYEREKN